VTHRALGYSRCCLAPTDSFPRTLGRHKLLSLATRGREQGESPVPKVEDMQSITTHKAILDGP
jgi:hypothetical protein